MKRKPLGDRTGRLIDGRSRTHAEPYGGSLRGALAIFLLAVLLPAAFVSPALAGALLVAVAAGRAAAPTVADRLRGWYARRRIPRPSERERRPE